jgi:hypothetical protein
MDLRSLRPLLDTAGPFASVYFDNTHNTEDAEQLLELRWRGLREQLRAQGTDESTLEAMDAAVLEAEPPSGPAGRGMVAAGGRVLVDGRLDEPPLSPVARSSLLPYLLPLAERPGTGHPYLIVVVDSAGADLRVVDERGDDVRTETVTGREHPLHKTRGGGWAHLRFQHRVEETVRHNIQDVSDEITRLADESDIRLIFLAGEVQARSGLRRRLPARCQEIAVEVESGGRAGGSDHAALEKEVEELARHRMTSPLTDQDPALRAAGLPTAVAALREANVATLLLVPARLQDSTVWMGSEPGQVSVREEELRGLGMPSITRHRADEALPWAALAVGADIVTVDDDLADGVGVLLRHT